MNPLSPAYEAGGLPFALPASTWARRAGVSPACDRMLRSLRRPGPEVARSPRGGTLTVAPQRSRPPRIVTRRASLLPGCTLAPFGRRHRPAGAADETLVLLAPERGLLLGGQVAGEEAQFLDVRLDTGPKLVDTRHRSRSQHREVVTAVDGGEPRAEGNARAWARIDDDDDGGSARRTRAATCSTPWESRHAVTRDGGGDGATAQRSG